MSEIGASRSAAIGAGQFKEGAIQRTFSSYEELRSRLKKIDIEKVKDMYPYRDGMELVLPSSPQTGAIPPNAKLMPVKMKPFKNIVSDFTEKYPEHEDKEMIFYKGGMTPPGFVAVGAGHTAISVYYDKETGKPMGED